MANQLLPVENASAFIYEENQQAQKLLSDRFREKGILPHGKITLC